MKAIAPDQEAVDAITQLGLDLDRPISGLRGVKDKGADHDIVKTLTPYVDELIGRALNMKESLSMLAHDADLARLGNITEPEAIRAVNERIALGTFRYAGLMAECNEFRQNMLEQIIGPGMTALLTKMPPDLREMMLSGMRNEKGADILGSLTAANETEDTQPQVHVIGPIDLGDAASLRDILGIKTEPQPGASA